MKFGKWLLALLLLLTTCFLTSCTLPFLNQKKKAALQVTTNVKATVFLNDQHVSSTPYFDENLKAGDYVLKLVPDASEPVLLPWQAQIKLSPGILTVVKRNLGENEEKSSGYILTLEPGGNNETASLSIISTPDSVVVTLDGEPKGFTPLSLDEIVPGEHSLNVSSPGYQEENIQAKAIAGHKLIINVQLQEEKMENLEKSLEATTSAETSTESKEEPLTEKEASPGAQMERPYVKIKDNSWGYLNLRSEPSISGGNETVITKIYPGEIYKYIEESENGWFQIEYEEGKLGWLSNKYATLYK